MLVWAHLVFSRFLFRKRRSKTRKSQQTLWTWRSTKLNVVWNSCWYKSANGEFYLHINPATCEELSFLVLRTFSVTFIFFKDAIERVDKSDSRLHALSNNLKKIHKITYLLFKLKSFNNIGFFGQLQLLNIAHLI